MRRRLAAPVVGALLLVACGSGETAPPAASNPASAEPQATPPSAEATTVPDGPVATEPAATSAVTSATSPQPPSSTTTAPSPIPSPIPTPEPPPTDAVVPAADSLARGDVGPEVERLQQELARHGFEVDIDGRFGPATDTAVRGFQYSHGLEVDGTVGPNTWAMLTSAGASSTVILRDDGLAVAEFGDPTVAVMPTLLDVLGTPEWDLTARMMYGCGEGLCEGLERTVRWWRPDEATFSVRFEQTEGDFEFVAWQLSGYGGRWTIGLATAEGVALGSTASELISVYPNADFGHFPEPGCGDAWWNPGEFRIGVNESDGARGLRGSVDHDWDVMLQSLNEALIAHGVPQGLDCDQDVMCADVFGEFQQSVGLPVGGGLERSTWLALGLPLPPNSSAPVQVLRAGQEVTSC